MLFMRLLLFFMPLFLLEIYRKPLSAGYSLRQWA